MLKTNKLIKLIIKNCQVLAISLFFMYTSCNKTKDCSDSKVHLLTNCNKTYWDAQTKDEKGIYGCYRFDIDGSCYYFKYNKKKERTFFIDNDIIGGANWWNLISQDTIEIQGGDPYEIVYFSKDTIEVRPILAKRIMILTKSENQNDHLDFDTIKTSKTSYKYFNKSKVKY